MKFEYFCSFIYVIMYLILLYICIQKLLNLPAILLSAILAIAFWGWPLPSAIRDLTNYASSSHWVLHAITVVGGNVRSKLQLAFKCFCMLCVFMPRNAYHHASNPAEFLLIQGMNEVLAPLFYVFKNDPDEENAVSTSLHALSYPSFSFSFKMLAEGHMLIQCFHLHKRKWKKCETWLCW